MIVVFLCFLKNFPFIKDYKGLPCSDNRVKLPKILGSFAFNPRQLRNES